VVHHVVDSSTFAKGQRFHWLALILMTTQNSLADQIDTTGHALTATELGGLLSISPKTIFKQAKVGRIPSFRVGTCVRFDPFSVARWLRKQ